MTHKINRLFSIILICSLCAALAGCGSSEKAESGTGSSDATSSSGGSSSIFDMSQARAKQVSLKGDGTDTTTILIYMNGSNLESEDGEASTDLAEMIAAGSSENVNILVCTIGTSYWQDYGIANDRTQIYKLDGSGLTLVNDSLGNLSVYDASSLNTFIAWGAQNYPADRYELIMWDHGGGPVYGFGYDDTQEDTEQALSIDEIQKALYYSGVYFDFIGFDACIMASLEVCCALYDYCDYMILSEDFESGSGWYYTNWLETLYSDPSATAEVLGKEIVDSTVSYNSEWTDENTIMALIDQSVMSILFSAWTDFAYANEDALLSSNYSQEIEGNGRTTDRFFGDEGGYGMDNMVNWDEDNVTMSDYFVTDIMAVAESISSDGTDALSSALNAAICYMNSSENETLTGLSVTIPYGDSDFYSDMKTVFTNCGFDSDYITWLGNFTSVSSSDYSDYYDYGDFNNNWNGWDNYQDDYNWSGWSGMLNTIGSLFGVFDFADSWNSWFNDNSSDYEEGYPEGGYEEYYGSDDYYGNEGDYYGDGEYFYGGDYYDNYEGFEENPDNGGYGWYDGYDNGGYDDGGYNNGYDDGGWYDQGPDNGGRW